RAAELPALPVDPGARTRRRASPAAVPGEHGRLRLPVHAPRATEPPCDPGRVARAYRDRPAGPPGTLHAVVRSARTRDLLQSRIARLLPHARVRAGSERVYERPRRDEGHRHLG